MYNHGHRNAVAGRVPDLLESLKTEFESVSHDANLYKLRAEDFERKFQGQLQEMQAIQGQIFEVERNFQKMKAMYESEIVGLRRQVESLGHQPVTSPEFAHFMSGGFNLNSTGNSLASTNAAALVNTNGPQMKVPGTHTASAIPKLGTASAFGIATPVGPMGPAGANSMLAFAPGQGVMKPMVGYMQMPSSAPGTISAPPVMSTPSLGGSGSVDIKSESKLDSYSAKRAAPTTPTTRQDGFEEITGDDWTLSYNTHVKKHIEVDLAHDFEHQSVVCCVKFSPDGTKLATGSNKSAQIFDTATGRRTHLLTDEKMRDGEIFFRSVAWSPDGQWLAAGTEDKTVKVWNVATGQRKPDFMGHEMDIYAVDYSKDGRYLVSGSGDRKIKVWDSETGRLLHTLGNDDIGPKDVVTSVAISPDGRIIAAGSLDYIVRIWDAETGYFLDRYEGHRDSVYSVAFDPDGKSLASGSLDKTVKLWDIMSRSRSRCRSTFTGHKNYVLSVAFSQDGNWLLSASKDRYVNFWDPRTTALHSSLLGHKNSVISVAITGPDADGSGKLASGSGDNRARVWSYKTVGQ